MASGISPVLVSILLAEHAGVNLPGIGPLLVDEPVQPPDWDNGTSREAVDRRTNGPSEAAGCWEGSEGEESDEDDCTPAWSPFASEAAPAASARSAAIFFLQPNGGQAAKFWVPSCLQPATHQAHKFELTTSSSS